MSRRYSSFRSLFFSILMVITQSAFAATPLSGWSKVILRSADDTSASVPADLPHRFGGKAVHDYASYRLIYVPQKAVAALRSDAEQAGINVEVKDEFDILEPPGGKIDTRVGLPTSVVSRERITPYPAGTHGLFLIQFIGPATAEWMEELTAAGATPLRYVPHNGLVIGAPAESLGAIQNLSFIQWADYYQPFSKAVSMTQREAGLVEFVVDIAPLPGHEALLSRLEELSRSGPLRIKKNSDLRARLEAPSAVLAELIHNQYVIGIHHIPDERISDERIALSITSNSTDQQPSSPTTYKTWLYGRCSGCTTLNTNGFKLSIADTGVDTAHLDFSGRITIGTNFYTPYVDPDTGWTEPANDARDFLGHGALVSSTAVGNAATPAGNPARDQLEGGGLGFYMGTGLAYSAGIVGTKIANAGGAVNMNFNIFDWAYDALWPSGARFQTHSHNDYSCGAEGEYSPESRDYDKAVRDANDDLTDGYDHMVITVSAGNTNQGCAGTQARPPATAKNVIAVGGAENYRPLLPTCNNCVAQSLANVMAISQRGTDTPQGADGRHRYKPDLTAPASMVVGARATEGGQNDNVIDWANGVGCNPNFDGGQNYLYNSGTSFAAPAAAGAALLAGRKYSATQGAARPSLVKAMLVGSARNMYGDDVPTVVENR